MDDFEMIDLVKFGETVKGWRSRLGLLQKQAAGLAGTTAATLSNLENHKRNGIRMDTYNHLVQLIRMEPRLFWWDYEKNKPGVMAKGQHDEVLFRGLCAELWGDMEVEVVDGVAMELAHGIFDSAPFRCGGLVRLPSTYGYKPVDGPGQGVFEACVLSL